MDPPLQYGSLARYYDLVYRRKDYPRESRMVRDLAESHRTSTGNDLLDIGCGTGNHLQHLTEWYSCVGVDINEEMLTMAREKVPGAEFVHADMLELRLGRRFDVIASLFSTIGYALTREDLGRFAEGVARHLVPGGVAIIEPWLARGELRPGYIGMETYGSDGLKLARLGRLVVDGDITVFEAHYLIGEGGEIRHLVDVQQLRLFDVEETLAALEAAGLEAWYREKDPVMDRGLVVARPR